MNNKNRRITPTHILFAIYCILLIWIILFKLSVSVTDLRALTGARSINLLPFYYKTQVPFQSREIMLNALIFIPFGLYLAMLKGKKPLLCGFLFSLILELCQLVFAIGASDITDIITNTLGTAAGVLLYRLLTKIFGNPTKTHKILVITASVATAAFTALLLLIMTV